MMTKEQIEAVKDPDLKDETTGMTPREAARIADPANEGVYCLRDAYAAGWFARDAHLEGRSLETRKAADTLTRWHESSGRE